MPNVLPQPLPFAPPIADPLPAPAPAPRPRPRPAAPAPTPLPIGSALPIGGAQLQPLPEPQPVPKEDPCEEQRKKAKKKRSPRTVCWKGTYLEKSSGLVKHRRVRVDCMTGRELGGTVDANDPR